VNKVFFHIVKLALRDGKTCPTPEVPVLKNFQGYLVTSLYVD